MLGIYTRLSVEDGASNSIKNQLFEVKHSLRRMVYRIKFIMKVKV